MKYTWPIAGGMSALLSEVAVRPARRPDENARLRLWVTYIREMRKQTKRYAEPDRAARSFWRAEMREAFAGRTSKVFVAVHRGRIIGTVYVNDFRHEPHIRPRRIGYIFGVYVAPRFRRQGVMERLLAEADSWCTRRGIRSRSAWVLADNPAALRIFAGLGFRPSAHYLIRD